MPGDRKKRRLTPNSTEEETKSKRVRKDSDAFKAGTASSKHEETSQEGITTLTLKRWDTSKYFFLLLFVFTYVYHVQWWDIPFLSPHLICKAFFSKFWLDPLRIMNLGSNIGRRNPYFANYCVPKLLFYVIRGFGIAILCFNLHFNFSICVGWRNLFLFLFWGVRISFFILIWRCRNLNSEIWANRTCPNPAFFTWLVFDSHPQAMLHRKSFIPCLLWRNRSENKKGKDTSLAHIAAIDPVFVAWSN